MLVLIALSCILLRASAINYDVSSASSVSSAAKTIAAGMLSYYTGYEPGGTPGLFPYPPYYWWESGTAFGHLVDYVYYTGNTQYNQEIIEATTWQAGMNGQFNPSNQSFDMGNDDQAYWTFTALNAAETNFPSPPQGYPEWAAMADIVFTLQAGRWDATTCGGGLHWQVFQINAGYNYMNVAANGAFFQLASRLARYTGNETYVHWAEKMWNWLEQSPLIDSSNGDAWKVYDGTQTAGGCTGAEKTQWTYNYGVLIGGLAYIYNHTEDAKWLTPLYGILNGTIDTFFNNDGKVIVEVSCEPNNNCDSQPNWTVFKSVTLRWLATTTQLVPQLADTLWPYLEASAKGAAGQCDGDGGTTCGYHFSTTTWDGTSGLGQEMTALAAVGMPLIRLKNLPAPLTIATGAKSNTSLTANGANVGTVADVPGWVKGPITTADKAGAAILTIMVVVVTVVGGWWVAKN